MHCGCGKAAALRDKAYERWSSRRLVPTLKPQSHAARLTTRLHMAELVLGCDQFLLAVTLTRDPRSRRSKLHFKSLPMGISNRR
jgi:hypothetical protein